MHRDPLFLEDHHLGLAHDLLAIEQQRLARRRALRWLGGAGAAVALAGCGGGGGDAGTGSGSVSAATTGSTTNTTTTTSTGTTTTTIDTTATTTTSCSTIPTETAGPYPADGTNTAGGGVVNALALSGILRSDIRSSIGGATGVADGVPLTVTLKLVNTSSSCASLAGCAVYLWHCDALGRYSMYSAGVTGENYLRGVQVADANGAVTFTTIFPACYSGRWPHIHFEVYANATAATLGTRALKTSQMAMPADAASAVFADARYSASVANFSHITLATDNVFSDGVTLETPTVTGSNSAGYAATLQVGVAA